MLGVKGAPDSTQIPPAQGHSSVPCPGVRDCGMGHGDTARTCHTPGPGCLHQHEQEKAALSETDTELVFIVFFLAHEAGRAVQAVLLCT